MMNIFNKINSPSQSVFFKNVTLYFGNRIIDILLHFPKGIFFKNLKSNVDPSDIGKIITLDLQIKEHKPNYNKRIPYKIITKTQENQRIDLLFFNSNKKYLLNSFLHDQVIKCTGKLSYFTNQYQLAHPKIVKNNSQEDVFHEFEPIYDLSRKKINKSLFRKLILKKIKYFIEEKFPEEWIEPNFVNENDWLSFKESIKKIHLTDKKSIHQYEKLRQRLAYDEILSSFLIFNQIKKKSNQIKKYKIHNNKNSDNLIKDLDFNLTTDQLSSISDIRDDLKKKRLYRLIQGDVGSGKTIIALLAIIDVIKSGYQAVIMAPTELLATQHYNYFTNYLDQLNIKIALLTSKVKNKEEIYSKIKINKINLLIGTHSVYNSKLKFKNLGIIVIDEQHKFGVQQRINLLEKSSSCHTLVMSATPIPRSLTFAIYGEIDVSNIKTKPEGRKKVITSLISKEKISNLLEGIKRKLKNNEQIFWVLPHIGEEDDDNSVLSRYKFLTNKFHNLTTLVHGRMTDQEIDKNMKDFQNKKKMILVSTTLIEVGINIPSASLMIIESANKFGLAQLHQLRGRIARGNLQSHCVLVYDASLSENSKQRLHIIKNSDDGFEIAEKDLFLRGSGDILGTNQSGLPKWRFFNPLKDIELVKFAKKSCERILQRDDDDGNEQKKFLISSFCNDSNFKNFTST